MTEEQKNEVDKLVQIYLNGVTSVSNDAGWHGMSMMARWIEFGGEMPPFTGYDQSNVTSLREIEYLRGIHAELPMIRAVVAVMLRDHRQEQILAILARHYYVGQNGATDRAWTDAERCERVGQNVRQFQYNVSKAYYSLLQEITVARHYKMSA
jgi:hypothetical protein